MSYTYSFIIPHHNCPNLLNRCLDSIPVRDDIQVIVVDDNSSDGKKPDILRANVTLITLNAQESKGAGHARNIGLSKARGTWVLFADADDYYRDGFISVLDKHKDRPIDVLYFNYDKVECKTLKPFDDNDVQRSLKEGGSSKNSLDVIRFKNNSPCTKMIRLDYIKLHRMYYEEAPNGNDVLFSLFVGSYTDNIAITGERLYVYLDNPNSIGTKKHSLPELECRIEHLVKHNAFNASIGYRQWNESGIRKILSFSRIYGSNVGFKLFVKYISVSVRSRNEWLTIIKSHKI